MPAYTVSFLAATMLDTFRLTPSSENISLVTNTLLVTLHSSLTIIPTAVDLTYGVVCCFQCGDYVYDKELEIIAQKHQAKAALSLGLGQVFQSWEPSEEEIELLKKHPKRKKITDSSIIGKEKHETR